MHDGGVRLLSRDAESRQLDHAEPSQLANEDLGETIALGGVQSHDVQPFQLGDGGAKQTFTLIQRSAVVLRRCLGPGWLPTGSAAPSRPRSTWELSRL